MVFKKRQIKTTFLFIKVNYLIRKKSEKRHHFRFRCCRITRIPPVEPETKTAKCSGYRNLPTWSHGPT